MSVQRGRDGSSLIEWPHFQVSVKRAVPDDYVAPQHPVQGSNPKLGDLRRAAEVRRAHQFLWDVFNVCVCVCDVMIL